MKIKYALPMLASLALASCSQDDDFVSNVQKSEFSPITFAVTLEGGAGAETRAWQDDENDFKYDWFKFEAGKELLSLWNGMTWSGSAWISHGSNAVFEGISDKNGEVLFSTRSLVNAGTAIMVYPADTTFYNTTASKLVVEIPAIQTATTVQAIPYASDVMDIAAYNGNTGANNSAGYGRKYDVALRQVAGLLTIKLAPTNSVDFKALGVDPIEYTEVQIANGTTGLFPTSIELKSSTTASPVATNDATRYGHYDKALVVADGTSKAAVITSTDIKNNTFVNFVVAPFTNATIANDASIKVSTSYGSVTVTNDPSAALTAVGPLQNTDKDQGINLAANLKNALDKTWAEASATSKYKSTSVKNVGAIVRRTLELDLSTLDMNNTVVTTSAQLVNLMKVYKALAIPGTVKFILNGAGGRFELTGEALQALKDYNTADNVSLDVATNTQKIVLADAGATLAKLADPTVNFVNGGSTPTPVDVILKEGLNWTLDQTYDGSKETPLGAAKVSKVINEGTLTYTNTTASATAAPVELELNKGTMSFAANSKLGNFTSAEDTKITVATGQTITFAGANATKINGEIDNNGIISAAGKFYNTGVIDNKFELSVLSGNSNYEIVNMGVIKNNGINAVTYITYNQNGAGTKMGRIILTNRNDNVSIKSPTKRGYIQYTLNEADVNGEYVYATKTGDVFNWLVIEAAGTVPTVKLNNNVDYLTIKGNAANVITPPAGITVTDLFVNPSMRLLGTNKITATNIYVNDYILHSGNLSGTQKTSYDSKVTGEDEDTTTYKNGVIRTVAGN